MSSVRWTRRRGCVRLDPSVLRLGARRRGTMTAVIDNRSGAALFLIILGALAIFGLTGRSGRLTRIAALLGAALVVATSWDGQPRPAGPALPGVRSWLLPGALRLTSAVSSPGAERRERAGPRQRRPSGPLRAAAVLSPPWTSTPSRAGW